ncbi:MAG: cupin domain-containing protein [Pseudomonadota bacterium]
MKQIHFADIKPVAFNNDAVKGVEGRVLIGKADGADNFCMRVFTVEKGGYSPRHSHAWEHEIFIHSGQGEAYGNNGWSPVTPGTALFIPGNHEHQLKNTGDEPLVFVCLIPSGAPEL